MQDTVKEVVDHTIQKTLDRSRLWRALTPQMIRYQRLYDSLKRALVDQVLITDEAGALEYSGYPVDIVVGDARNIKVTTATDLPLAEMILKDMHA
jgi:2-C-methyl-D-erythritol 4-phosphate cytidylyltransferase